MLYLSEQIVNEIREHGARDYPNETCGAMLGLDNDADREVLALFPLTNRRDDSPRNRFSITSDDVRAAEKAARASKLDVLGWYHSHPDHPAKPSEFDREHAWPWYSYIIVSVAAGKPELMTSWRLVDDRTHYLPEEIATRASAPPAQ
jgi:proteasome lid subunit RPN8/RPN11